MKQQEIGKTPLDSQVSCEYTLREDLLAGKPVAGEKPEDAAVILARLVARTHYGHLPPKVIEVAKVAVLDTIACALGGSATEMIDELLGLVRDWGGKKESTILVHGDRVPAPVAALVNGMQGHALDYDSTYDGPVKPGIAAVPAALAIAERKGKVSGKELIPAVAVGCEVIMRMGLTPLSWDGFNVANTMGYFGAAAACGKVLGLNEEQMVNCLGLAYAQTTGENEGIREATLSKRLNRGLLSWGGVFAALMAQRGMTAARNSLEGPYGLYNLHHRGRYNREVLLTGLGKTWEVEKLYFKAYPSGTCTHAPIDAALVVANNSEFVPDRVREIVARLRVEEYYNLTCTPIEAKRTPKNVVDSQFSIPYIVASALVDKKVNIDTFSEEAIKRPQILALAQKVKAELHEAVPGGRLEAGAEVDVIMDDGRVFKGEVNRAKGTPENPMTDKDFADKLYDCAAHAAKRIPPAKLDRLLSMTRNLEQLDDVSKLAKAVS